MLADLDLLLIAVFCAADDLLPRRAGNGRRILIDAEVVTLAVAQAIMGIPSDERFLAAARRRLSHLFPLLPQRSGYYKRRERLSDTIEALIEVFARDSPGFYDDLVLVDSTPIECARSIETTRRSRLADAADYGYCSSHSRYFWGFRLHGLFALDGTPRALHLSSPKTPEREICLKLLAQLDRDRPLTVVGDKGYAGREFEQTAKQLEATIIRPQRRDEAGPRTRLAPIRQRIESIFHTCKDLLTLERHGARTLHGLRTRICSRFLALAAAISLNHRLGRPTRALVAYTT
jgi:Transposase DDE domain